MYFSNLKVSLANSMFLFKSNVIFVPKQLYRFVNKD